MNIYVFKIFFFVLFLLMFFFFLFFFSFAFLEWVFFSLKLKSYMNFLLFSFVLFLIVIMVIVYSSYYMNNDLHYSYYCFMLLCFVFSMFMLNFSSSVFSLMISWDLLGISSFFLVLFYNNWDSNSGAMSTVMTNRIGDFFLFIFLGGSFFLNMFLDVEVYLFFFMVFFLLFGSFTKSAQFPFSGWLPKAMSAPTPVSSLVHSSTLVTAGLILLMNYWMVLFNVYFLRLMFFMGLFTMFFSSVLALLEEDMKKVVALSTLSQLGFMMLSLGLGMFFLSFFHLLSHALFKSCLFMQMGYIMHKNMSEQDNRNWFNSSISEIVKLQILVTLFCLCGLFFFSGMVSKDLLLEFFFYGVMGWLILLFFFFVVMTFFYSYRLFKSLMMKSFGVVMIVTDSYLMNFLCFMLVIFSVFFMSWLSVNLFFVPSVFIYVDFYLPLFFCLFFFSVFFLIVKFVSKSIKWKFLSDYLNVFLVRFFFNSVFMSNLLDKLGGMLFMNVKVLSIFFKSFSSFWLNSVMLMIFLLVIVF
uniref:NADH:ubiquinone reductase (H(+)-translocating) n=1 Tax=Dictyocaulus eckerti TaxID=44604 RepID=K7QMC0_DICEC|nr:NADH dehydrogenase subunit 5 [Dictyocaulus eckerti]AFV32094.1 NADH dehydrogenase subunit 5 [Dictyocaulus eckerti]